MNTKDPRFTLGSITQLTDKGVQQTVDAFGDVATRFINVQVAQMDAAVRAKLIELGWTPPCDQSEDVPRPYRLALIHGLLNPCDNGTLCRYEEAIEYAGARCAQSRINTKSAMQALLNLATDRAEKAEAECDAIAERVKTLEANDRRYRWLRAGHENLCATKLDGRLNEVMIHGDELDAAIDAAVPAGDPG